MGDGIAEGKGGLGERVAQQQRGVATGGGQRGVVGLVAPRPLAELVVDLAPELLLESGVDERGGLGGRGRCEGRLFPALHGYYYYCCIEDRHQSFDSLARDLDRLSGQRIGQVVQHRGHWLLPLLDLLRLCFALSGLFMQFRAAGRILLLVGGLSLGEPAVLLLGGSHAAHQLINVSIIPNQ